MRGSDVSGIPQPRASRGGEVRDDGRAQLNSSDTRRPIAVAARTEAGGTIALVTATKPAAAAACPKTRGLLESVADFCSMLALRIARLFDLPCGIASKFVHQGSCVSKKATTAALNFSWKAARSKSGSSLQTSGAFFAKVSLQGARKARCLAFGTT